MAEVAEEVSEEVTEGVIEGTDVELDSEAEELDSEAEVKLTPEVVEDGEAELVDETQAALT